MACEDPDPELTSPKAASRACDDEENDAFPSEPESRRCGGEGCLQSAGYGVAMVDVVGHEPSSADAACGFIRRARAKEVMGGWIGCRVEYL